MVDYIVEICSFLTAVFTFAMAYFGWRSFTRNTPSVSVYVKDLPYANQRGYQDEALQKQGFCYLDVWIRPTTDDYSFHSIVIPHCQIPYQILNFDGSFANQSADKMTHASVPFNLTMHPGDSPISFDLLIKPDAEEKADLVLIMRGPLFTSVRVPFQYQKTLYIGE